MMISRRGFLAGGAALATGRKLYSSESTTKLLAPRDKALIAITLDLEMARNFPTWEQTHWDYHKGDLDAHAKQYTVQAARRVKTRGWRIHTFLVGAALEQENIDWLKELIGEGHFVGNHTYDHVYLLAQKPPEIQFRFERAPWLIHGKSVSQVIRENIEMCSRAMKMRLGIEPAGFRTPGGFAEGLRGRPDVQRMLLDLGFPWVSCTYPGQVLSQTGREPTPEVLEAIRAIQPQAQPFKYPSGLIDVPMSPVSDINAFRNYKWKLDGFLKATRVAVEWAIEHRAVFDFLAHPSALGVVDPEFRTIDLICDLVERAGDKAAIVDLGTIAARAT